MNKILTIISSILLGAIFWAAAYFNEANAQYIQLDSRGFYVGETARNWAGAIEAEKPIVPNNARAKWVDGNWLIISEKITYLGDYDFVEREFQDRSKPIKECSDRDKDNCEIVGYKTRVQLVPQLNQKKRQSRIAQEVQRQAQQTAREVYEQRRRQAETDLKEALIKGDGERFRSRQEIREIIDNRKTIKELIDRIEALEEALHKLEGNDDNPRVPDTRGKR